MMGIKIEQLDLTNENLLELLKDYNVYYVRVTLRELKAKSFSEEKRDEILEYPYGLGFSRLNMTKFRELFPLLESGEVAIVRVTNG